MSKNQSGIKRIDCALIYFLLYVFCRLFCFIMTSTFFCDIFLHILKVPDTNREIKGVRIFKIVALFKKKQANVFKAHKISC